MQFFLAPETLFTENVPTGFSSFCAEALWSYLLLWVIHTHGILQMSRTDCWNMGKGEYFTSSLHLGVGYLKHSFKEGIGFELTCSYTCGVKRSNKAQPLCKGRKQSLSMQCANVTTPMYIQKSKIYQPLLMISFICISKLKLGNYACTLNLQ